MSHTLDDGNYTNQLTTNGVCFLFLREASTSMTFAPEHPDQNTRTWNNRDWQRFEGIPKLILLRELGTCHTAFLLERLIREANTEPMANT